MKMLTRTLLALTLAGSTIQVAACGDEEPSKGDDMGDGDGDGDITGDGDAGTGDSDAGTGGEASECPKHPNVTSEATVCVLTGTLGGNEVKENLTIGPVKGKEGWLLRGGVFVGEDVGFGATPDTTKKAVTLTVLPGTTVFGESDLSFLLIQRGSKLVAEGTKAKPITFTSYATPGQEDRGDWGGIVLNGRAPVNAGTNVAGEAGTGFYGGSSPEDSSGSLQYVRVYYGGGKVDAMNELNGIAFQGVGNGTKVDYIHVHANDDDGVEFFGGTVNVKHVVITAITDDGIDWTSGWVGKMQFGVVKQIADLGDNGIEADNTDPSSETQPFSNPTLSNITLIGSKTAISAYGALLRRKTKGSVSNAVVTGFKKACVSYKDGSEGRLTNSRIFCEPNFEGEATGSETMSAFTAGVGNAILPSGDVLTGFLPKSDSGLLTGAAIPADTADFAFEDVPFIGAFGTEDWTAGWTESKFLTP